MVVGALEHEAPQLPYLTTIASATSASPVSCLAIPSKLGSIEPSFSPSLNHYASSSAPMAVGEFSTHFFLNTQKICVSL
jgi:hypothetical protein